MKNLQNTRHSDLIIYISYATYVYQALEASGGCLIIYQLQLCGLVLIFRKLWLHIVKPLAFRISHV
jgi:hypothetical protein